MCVPGGPDEPYLCVPGGPGEPYLCVPGGPGEPYLCVPGGPDEPYLCVPGGPGEPYLCVPGGPDEPYLCVPGGPGEPYLCVPGGPEVGQKVSALHELQDDELWVVMETDAQQPQDVRVFEVTHQQRFLEELLLLLIRRAFMQCLRENEDTITIQWNPSCAATSFAPRNVVFQEGWHVIRSGVEINTFMFRFTLLSGFSRGGGLISGGSIVYSCMISG